MPRNTKLHKYKLHKSKPPGEVQYGLDTVIAVLSVDGKYGLLLPGPYEVNPPVLDYRPGAKEVSWEDGGVGGVQFL